MIVRSVRLDCMSGRAGVGHAPGGDGARIHAIAFLRHEGSTVNVDGSYEKYDIDVSDRDADKSPLQNEADRYASGMAEDRAEIAAVLGYTPE